MTFTDASTPPGPVEQTVAHSQTEPTVHPEALLARARPSAWVKATRESDRAARACRRIALELLDRMRHDQLVLVDHTLEHAGREPKTTSFGSPQAELAAHLTIHDPRAWTALVSEGSVGLGRGYFEGWWDSDDPTSVVRVIIRNIEPLDDLRNRLDRSTGWAGDRIRRLLPRAGRRRNKEDIASHYDLGNDFFRLFLDETLTYSSAVFPSAEAALAEGSHFKYDRLIAKLGIDDADRVLEIGTGWGGFALRAVDTTGCRVTTTTISSEQLREAKRRVSRSASSERVTLLDRDWRDLAGRFDRVVSIEMIEAVDWRDYDDYFATIERCLEPDGLVAIQAICVPDRRFERAKTTEDFIRRFIFPGGFLPSIGAISRSLGSATKLQIVDTEDLSAHYAETLRRWRERFDERIDDVTALGLDERFCRLWRFYLAYCEAGFLERHCTVNQIVIAGPNWRPQGLSLRPS